MTGLSDTVNSDENPPLAELRRLKSQAQSGERRRQLRREAQKIESKKPNPSDPEPQEAEMAKPQRKKKRNFFKWLLTPSVATNRQVAPPRVRVKIPIVYRNGEHKGVVVGGVRVPFSRPMQANRRRLLLSRDDVSSVIPEDTEFVLEFPPRLAREEFETEHKRKEQEKNKLKYEKLAKELAK
ncbi:hypothetical protein KRP22_014308 [Phytophthora ramorum]|uniref:Uncharacterized protein n=1 Tax=Phytophthora ramorum TaxID=164328 RepID=H3GPV3_PHYRM|nr:hypothetical protein KRP23_12131 [Phytophthora ramorum]KAH7501634.1 hypothetical protein KRP22_9092 [Phytophthora ramorum]